MSGDVGDRPRDDGNEPAGAGADASNHDTRPGADGSTRADDPSSRRDDAPPAEDASNRNSRDDLGGGNAPSPDDVRDMARDDADAGNLYAGAKADTAREVATLLPPPPTDGKRWEAPPATPAPKETDPSPRRDR